MILLIDEVFEGNNFFWFMLGATVSNLINPHDWEKNVEEIVQQYYGMWLEAELSLPKELSERSLWQKIIDKVK